MKKKTKITISVLICLVISFSIIGTVYYQNTGKYMPKTVLLKPLGFVSLNNAMEENEAFIRYDFFENAVFFSDKDENPVATWQIKDSNFIVKYSGELYVNEEKFEEMVSMAKQKRE